MCSPFVTLDHIDCASAHKPNHPGCFAFIDAIHVYVTFLPTDIELWLSAIDIHFYSNSYTSYTKQPKKHHNEVIITICTWKFEMMALPIYETLLCMQ